MKASRLIFIILPILTWITSCSPYVNIVEVQTLAPPSDTTLNLSFSNKKVAIVGSIYYIDTLATTGKDRFLFDSIHVANATLGMKDALEQSPVFNGYSIPIYYSYTTDTTSAGKAIPSDEVVALAADIDADLLVSLDYIDLLIKRKNEMESMSEDVEFLGAYVSVFRIYDGKSGLPLAKYTVNSEGAETFTFFDTSGYPLLLTVDEAMATMAKRIGETYSYYITPYWEVVNRVFYVGPDDSNKLLSRAEDYVLQENWTKALEYWDKAISSTTKKQTIAMAAFNMALGCEMLDELDLAMSWLEYCKKQNTKVDPSSYLTIIKQRIEDKKKLNNILGVNSVSDTE